MDSGPAHWAIPMSTYMSRSSSDSCESSSTEWMSDSSEPFISGGKSMWGMNGGSYGKSTHGQVWVQKNEIMQWGVETDVEDVFFDGGSASGQDRRGLVDGLGWDNKVDLLDSLVMEDQEDKMMKKAQVKNLPAALQLPSLDNLLKLLELQSASDPPPGRPIIGSHVSPRPSTKYQDVQHVQDLMSRQVPLVFPGQFPPINFKVPPPHHPPAVPANFHLPSYSNPLPATIHVPLPYTSTPVTSPYPTPGSAADILLRMDEAQWQFQALETDRKKTEAALAKQNPGKRISSSNTVQVPRLPPGPTRLDKLVVDSMREQVRVVTLTERVERLRGHTFSPGLHNSLAMWRERVVTIMAMRRRERMGLVGRKGGKELGEALAKLSEDTRKARTVLWSVLVGGAGKV